MDFHWILDLTLWILYTQSYLLNIFESFRHQILNKKALEFRFQTMDSRSWIFIGSSISLYESYTHNRILLNIYESFRQQILNKKALDFKFKTMDSKSWIFIGSSMSLYGPYTHNCILLNVSEIFRWFGGSWTQDHGSLDLGSHFMDPNTHNRIFVKYFRDSQMFWWIMN